MIYNKNCGPVAIKTKKTMKLSRGFLTFVFIFGLSAALTAEARPRGKNSASPKFREDTRKQAAGQRPTRNRQTTEIEMWNKFLKELDLDTSDKDFTNVFTTFKKHRSKDLEFILKELNDLAKDSSPWLKDVIKSTVMNVKDNIVMNVKNNNGSGDKVLVLEVMLDVANHYIGKEDIGKEDIGVRNGDSNLSAGLFLKTLSLTLKDFENDKRDGSFREILETSRDYYNNDVKLHNYTLETGYKTSTETARLKSD